MSTRTLQFLGIIAIVLVIIGVVVLFFNLTGPKTPEDGGTTFPIGGEEQTETPPEAFDIVLNDGSVRSVPNFTLENQPEAASPENGFQVAGDASTGDFQILYFPSESYFLVSLFVEPLGATRLEAESALRSKLGLSDSDLCTLHSEVTTPNSVNEFYSGKSLGLSFCPGAVPLP